MATAIMYMLNYLLESGGSSRHIFGSVDSCCPVLDEISVIFYT